MVGKPQHQSIKRKPSPQQNELIHYGHNPHQFSVRWENVNFENRFFPLGWLAIPRDSIAMPPSHINNRPPGNSTAGFGAKPMFVVQFQGFIGKDRVATSDRER